MGLAGVLVSACLSTFHIGAAMLARCVLLNDVGVIAIVEREPALRHGLT